MIVVIGKVKRKHGLRTSEGATVMGIAVYENSNVLAVTTHYS